MGPELMDVVKKQAVKFGAEAMFKNVSEVDFSKRPFSVKSENETFTADSIIISTGASAKLIGIESEKALMGYGVSACATCDGFFFRDREVIVVGGGDTAMEEATFLTKFASRVTVVHRRESLRASKIMQERAFKNPKIKFIWNSIVDEVLGVENKHVRGVMLKNVATGEKSEIKCDGVFVAIGHQPNTAIFKGQIETDQIGYIITKNGSTETNVPGVFAAGDVADKKYRQAVTAAGTGCMAAIDAEKFLESLYQKED